MQQDGTKGKDETVNRILNECSKMAKKEKNETVTRILNECCKMAQKEKIKQWITS